MLNLISFISLFNILMLHHNNVNSKRLTCYECISKGKKDDCITAPSTKRKCYSGQVCYKAKNLLTVTPPTDDDDDTFAWTIKRGCKERRPGPTCICVAGIAAHCQCGKDLCNDGDVAEDTCRKFLVCHRCDNKKNATTHLEGAHADYCFTVSENANDTQREVCGIDNPLKWLLPGQRSTSTCITLYFERDGFKEVKRGCSGWLLSGDKKSVNTCKKLNEGKKLFGYVYAPKGATFCTCNTTLCNNKGESEITGEDDSGEPGSAIPTISVYFMLLLWLTSKTLL